MNLAVANHGKGYRVQCMHMIGANDNGPLFWHMLLSLYAEKEKEL